MRRRHKKADKHSNHTLDGFMKGLTTENSKSHHSNSKITPKIKVPASSGYQPSFKPIDSPFIYPELKQFRQYQYQIAIQCVTHNTLVSLPTGLGKTFIASVIIYNYYIWFPKGKIFFLAPTKPLVDQQHSSLLQSFVMIDKKYIQCFTGCSVKKRVSCYKQKRIIFCTPQTLQNDLKNNQFNKKQIVLLVFDQAHRATGNYSYANIIRILDKQVFGYRIVGLSATPGNTKQQIQQVLTNLLISKLIVKFESDPDVAKYLKKKEIQKIFIQPSAIIREICAIFDRMAEKQFGFFVRLRVCSKFLWKSQYGIDQSSFFMIKMHVQNKIHQFDYPTKTAIYAILKNLHFLAAAKSSLKNSGYQKFLNDVILPIQQSLQNHQNTTTTTSTFSKLPQKFKTLLIQDPQLTKIRTMFSSKYFTQNKFIHPKLQKLSEILIQFYSAHETITKKSKTIIFAQYRSTCFEIKKYLQQFQMVRAEMFFGQSKTVIEDQREEETVSTSLQMKQREQKILIAKFKNNQVNTLISTSIGEEGLDIGEVDCIVCYDNNKNVIRSIQRMGRTGRKRDGKVYVLLMEGKQTASYINMDKRSKQMKNILNERSKFQFYGFNPTMFEQGSQIMIKRIVPQTIQTDTENQFGSSQDQIKYSKSHKNQNQNKNQNHSKSSKLNNQSDSNNSFGQNLQYLDSDEFGSQIMTPLSDRQEDQRFLEGMSSKFYNISECQQYSKQYNDDLMEEEFMSYVVDSETLERSRQISENVIVSNQIELSLRARDSIHKNGKQVLKREARRLIEKYANIQRRNSNGNKSPSEQSANSSEICKAIDKQEQNEQNQERGQKLQNIEKKVIEKQQKSQKEQQREQQKKFQKEQQEENARISPKPPKQQSDSQNSEQQLQRILTQFKKSTKQPENHPKNN